MRASMPKPDTWPGALAMAAVGACSLLSALGDDTNSLSPQVSASNAPPASISTESKPALPILIYDPSVAAGAEAALRQSYDRVRAEFLGDLYTASKRRRLTRDQVTSPGFDRFVQWFQKKRPEFPMSSSLANAWACGSEVEEQEEQLASTLRSVMTNYIVSKWLPAAEVRLVYSAGSPHFAGGTVVSNLLSAAETRSEVYRTLGLAEPLAGAYVCQYLRENCIEVASLAEPARNIDQPAVMLPFLEKASSKSVENGADRPAPDWRNQLRNELLTITTSTEEIASWVTGIWSSSPLLVSGIGALCLIAITGWVLRRDDRGKPRKTQETQTAYTVVLNPDRNETIFLPVESNGRPKVTLAETASSGAVLAPQAEGAAVLLSAPADPEWENRVLASEKRAQELMSKIRAGLAPHLAQAMVNELVQRLLMDRAALLQAQHIATGELKEIEARFTRMQEELAERLRSYQERNAELERELSARSVQNRELLRTQIESLEKKLG